MTWFIEQFDAIWKVFLSFLFKFLSFTFWINNFYSSLCYLFLVNWCFLSFINIFRSLFLTISFLQLLSSYFYVRGFLLLSLFSAAWLSQRDCLEGPFLILLDISLCWPCWSWSWGQCTCLSRTHNFLANIFFHQAYNCFDFQWKLSFHLFLWVLLIQCCWRLMQCSKHLVFVLAKAAEPERWPCVNSFPSVGMVIHRWRYLMFNIYQINEFMKTTIFYPLHNFKNKCVYPN